MTHLVSLLPEALSHALVAASLDVSLAVQRQRFLGHAHQGRKPLWLAVGGAWTGLDVGGHSPWRALFGEEMPPEVDNILTDLVIPRIPLGTNKTITHKTRMERNSTVPWDALDARIKVKQGIGRLIRRGGLPNNRRIFILDGRMNDPVFSGYLSRVQALVRPYAVGVLKKS